MTTQYTPTLKLALPVTGELSGTWGDVVNDNITSMIEQAIAGLSTINTWTANAHTLTTANGTTSESRCAMLVAATGAGGTALTGVGEIICPSAAKLYVVQNTTAFVITLKTSAGTGVAVAAGDTAFLFCDATNVNSCVTTIVNGNITGNLTVGGNATINGNTTLGNATSDTITATARFASDLVPSTDNARDLGSAANSWRSLWIDGTATMALVAIAGGTIDGVSIGSTTAATIINVDNLRLDGNTLSSTDTNGNVVIAPNGTGDVQLDADTVRVGDAAAAATLTSNGAGALTVTTGGTADLTLSTNAGVNSGTVVIANGVNGNITLTPNGTGDVILSADRVQMGDSNTDTTLTTNGTGNLNLTTNDGTNSGTIQIAQGINGNITLTPNGTGSVSISKLYSSGNTTLGATSANTLSVAALVNSNLLFTDATYDIGASGATRPRDLFLSRNLTVGGTLTLTGGVNLNGNVTVGDASTDTLTINSTITSNLIFTDNTYDIGASGATRPRNLYLAGTATIGGNTAITGTLSATAGTSVATSSGYLTVGTVSATGMNASDIGIPNNKYLRGTVVAGTSSVALIGLDSGNIVQINANDSSGGTNITGNLGLGGTVNSYGSQTTLTLSGTNVSRIDFRSNGTYTGTILSYQTVTEGLRLQTEAGYPIAFYPAGTLRASISAAGVFSTTLGATIQGLTVGLGAGAVATNTAVGYQTLNANTTGARNQAFGYQAMLANLDGSDNAAFGTGALSSNLGGANNSAFGSGVTAVAGGPLASNQSGDRNVAVGGGALVTNVSGSYNCAVGVLALRLATGSYNVAMGYQAATTMAASGNGTFIGSFAGIYSTGTDNTAVGYAALGTVSNPSAAAFNTAIGSNALTYNSTGNYNTALGYSAANRNTISQSNVAIGYTAMYGLNTSAGGNVAIGSEAMYDVVHTAGTNIAIGLGTMRGVAATGAGNIAIGQAVMYPLTTGADNTIIGGYSSAINPAGRYLTSGSYNVGMGSGALAATTSGSDNVAIGHTAGYTNQAGRANTFVGFTAGFTSNYSGYAYNTAIGERAGYLLDTGTVNTFVGSGSGYYVSSGSKNTILGRYSGNQEGLNIITASNAIVLSDGDGFPKYYSQNAVNTDYNYSVVSSLTAGSPYNLVPIKSIYPVVSALNSAVMTVVVTGSNSLDGGYAGYFTLLLTQAFGTYTVTVISSALPHNSSGYSFTFGLSSTFLTVTAGKTTSMNYSAIVVTGAYTA